MFEYQKLDPNNNEIRLLQVLPAWRHSALLQCSISHFPAAEAPLYHALSYTWGMNDWVCAVHGVSVPFIIREHENGYMGVGDFYVQGLMKAEAVTKVEEKLFEVQTITLI